SEPGRPRICVGVERRVTQSLTRPEAGAAALAAVGLGVRPARIAGHRARRSGCAAPREARHGEIERSPEEVDWTALPDETRTEFLEHPVRLERGAPEALGRIRVVGAMGFVAIEWDRALDLGGPGADRGGDIEL